MLARPHSAITAMPIKYALIIPDGVADEPQASLGSLVSLGARRMEAAPWVLLYPAALLALILFCFNFLGDGLRDRFDPKGGAR